MADDAQRLMTKKKKPLPPREVRIHVLGLQPGMYVSRLDIPWAESPYLVHGFKLQGAEDIRKLQGVCSHVYIDTASGIGPAPRFLVFEEAPLPRRDGPRDEFAELRQRQWPLPTLPTESELPAATTAYAALREAVAASADAAPDPPALAPRLEPALESVLRQPAALLWLHALQRRRHPDGDEATARVLWALVFGRELGLDRPLLRQLALAALLCQLPAEVLAEPPATAAPIAIQAASQRLGEALASRLQALQGKARLPPQVQEMLAHHRARHDGRGHPWGEHGAAIPLLARLLSVVVRYCELAAAPAGRTPRHAVRALYEERGQRLQPTLVDHFIAACGLYPPGALVELTDGSAGLVLEAAPEHRLRPRLHLLRDALGRALPSAPTIDLAKAGEDASGQALCIRSDLTDATLSFHWPALLPHLGTGLQ